MLHDGHQLNYVVSQVLDPWQHVFGKLLIRRDSEFGRGDANMSFVDPSTRGLLRYWMLEDILLGRRWVPESRVVCTRDRQILSYVFDPGW
jgi:hypothetical protein